MDEVDFLEEQPDPRDTDPEIAMEWNEWLLGALLSDLPEWVKNDLPDWAK